MSRTTVLIFRSSSRAADILKGATAAASEIRRRFKNGLLIDRYRPELHYMRGPGPKSREKARALSQRR